MGGFALRNGAATGFARRLGLPPVTATLLAVNVLTFLVEFFAQRPVFAFLDFAPHLALVRPWSWISYPLHAPESPIYLVFLGLLLWWCISELEHRWGSLEFGLLFTACAIIGAMSAFVASSLLGLSGSLTVVAGPFVALFIAWCMLNPDATIRIYLVLPVKARWVAYGSLVILYFSTGPLVGIFALVAPLFAWWYAVRGRIFRRIADRIRVRSRVASIDSYRHPSRWAAFASPIEWWRRRRRRREFELIAKRMGLDEAQPSPRRDDTIN